MVAGASTDTSRRGARRLAWLALLCASLWLWPTSAQERTWIERRTASFVIVHAPADAALAERYAGFVDAIYDEVVAFWTFTPATPVTLRLFATTAEYQAEYPLAAAIDGIIAHADFRRNEVVVIDEMAAPQGPDGLQNAVRHELTHIIASDLTAGRLNTGFHEGIAQFAEQPGAERERKNALLASALASDRLLPWNTFDDRAAFYGAAAIAYPQALSVVSYLVERAGFPTLRTFLEASARSSGYRSALERAYGVPPAELEAAWRAWLPGHLGGTTAPAVAADERAAIVAALDEGAYERASGLAEAALVRARAGTDAALVAELEPLARRAARGVAVRTALTAIYAALQQQQHDEAARLIAQVQPDAGALGDAALRAALEEYTARSARGIAARQALAQAEALSGDWRATLAAREQAAAAAAEFVALGDRERARVALALHDALDGRFRWSGGALLACGAGIVALSVLWRLRRPAGGEPW